jgi:RHS repeat-associated protein
MPGTTSFRGSIRWHLSMVLSRYTTEYLTAAHLVGTITEMCLSPGDPAAISGTRCFGYFRYNYGSVTYSSGFTQSEVTSRVMSKDGTTGSEVTYPFTHESSTSSYPIHQFTTMADPGGVGQKYWAFSQSGASIGLVTTYKGQQYPGPTTLTENDFTWSQDANSNFYIGSTLTTWTYTPGGPYQTQSKVNQTVDVYGNVTQVQKFQFGSLSTPARTYNYSYLNSSSYTSQYIYNRLSTATVTDGTTTTYLASNGYDSNYRSVTNPSTTPYEWDTGYSSATYRGNLTSSSTPSGSASYAYDNAGNIGYATVNGVETASVTSTTTNFAAPDQLTVGSLSTSMSWNAFLGPTSDTGPNGDSISESYDTYARPTQVTSPFGATTSYVYNSPPFSSSSPATVTIYPNGTSGRWTKNTLDGFGRTIKTEAGDSSSTYSSSEMVYAPCACSPIGKLYQQSMAHAPGASSPTWTTYTYDGIGRTLTAATVGSDTQGTTSYYYYNYTSTDLYTVVEDAAGNYKLYLTDVFNNLAEVYEPATSSEPSGAYTYYGYDLLDHLTGVYMSRTAGLQTRSFTYSGNNLTSATNPENGTVTYTYNSYNKVATKTDAKGQAIVYTYDTLARLTEVQKYPSGTGSAEDTCQRENYYYDTTYISGYSNYPSGRLTAVQYYGGSSTYGSFGSPGSCDTQFVEAYNYSQPGGKVGKRLQITRNNIAWSSHSPSTGSATANLDSTYTYDNEGRMITEQYPVSGPYLGWAVDSMGRWNTMTDLGLSSSIITGATYGPSNELLSTSGNLGESRTYNSMLQLTQLYVGVIGGTTMGITYGYPSSNNNGKISSQTDNNSGEVVQYTYDALNRLASATATSSAWGQSYSYDGFGNLTGQTVTVGSAPSYSASPNASTNAVGSADANGNYIGYIPGTYLYPAYDVMNRMVSIGYGNTIAYSYAPGNKRVWRGLWTSGSLTTDELTFWSVSGQKLGTYSITVNTGSGSTPPSFTLTQTATNFYFGRKLIKNGNGSSYYWSGNYLQADRLGSVGKYYPYGQEKPSATTNGTEKFTGYFRDAETGLDYADQRFHNPGTGRFLTPDPYTASAGSADPGSWNRYAYTRGDPVNRVDSGGLDDGDADDGADADDCEDDRECNPDGVDGGGGSGGEGTGPYDFGNYDSVTVSATADPVDLESADTGLLNPIFSVTGTAGMPGSGGGVGRSAQKPCWQDISASQGNSLVSSASTYIGTPYKTPSTPNGMVCTDLVCKVIRKLNPTFPISAPAKGFGNLPGLRPIGSSPPQPGDVIVFPGHVGILDPTRAPSSVLSAQGTPTRSTPGVKWGQPGWFGSPFNIFRIQIPCN